MRHALVPLLTLALCLMAAQPRATAHDDTLPQVVEKVIDGVVNITASQVKTGEQNTPIPNVPDDSPYAEFFKEFFDKQSSSAARKNLKAGQVIVELQGEKNLTPAQFGERIETMKKGGKETTLLLVSDKMGDLRFVALPVK